MVNDRLGSGREMATTPVAPLRARPILTERQPRSIQEPAGDLERCGFRDLPPSYRNSMKVMRFTLADEQDRTFRVQRWCIRGSIDDWINLWMSRGEGKLHDLVRKFCPHIGQESFYELM
jgi:hypothetical protein